MSDPKDGGPAFPSGDQNWIGGQGMSLRDWFAAKALPVAMETIGIIGDNPNAEMIARTAYEIADAMLKARKPHPTE